MTWKDKQLIERVDELRKAIRRKYRNFKDGTTSTELELEKQYKPILSELRKNKAVPDIKSELKEEPQDDEHFDEDFRPGTSSSPKFVPFLKEESVHETAGDDSDTEEDVSSVLATPEGTRNASHFVEQQFSNELTKKYMKKLFKGIADRRLDKIDHTYGPRYEDDKLKIGDQELTFDNDGSIWVGGTSYKPTEGLYELIFKWEPNERLYKGSDLIAYKSILVQSNAHKKNYNYLNHVNRIYRSSKYKDIIAKLFPARTGPVKSGKGLKWKSTKARDLVHWDNPNELVERLKHLVMSTEAGNKGHSNEIINIIDELHESKYISGKGNSRFSLLVK